MVGFSQEQLIFFRHHLFLPPGLPQEDDQDVGHDDALLKLVIVALEDFGDLRPGHQRSIVDDVAAAVRQLSQTRNVKDGVVNEEELLKAFKMMSEADGPAAIPLHINAQNAGVIFSTCSKEDGVLFQAFEVLPTNSAAMGTQGRLRRCFPGPVLCIGKEHFKKPDFLSTLANKLSTLSLQQAPGMTPTVRKSGNDVDETRDTIHPGLVTELVVAFLQPFSSFPPAQRIWKHTREEVLWDNAYMPWRRSPLWLVLRTVMQLLFTQFQISRSSEPAVANGRSLFKLFMIYLLARVLSESVDESASTEPDMLSCMNAKIYRRLLKLNPAEHEPGMSFVQGILDKTRHCLEDRWSSVQGLDNKVLDLDCLKSLDFENDVSLTLPELDGFLSDIPERSLATDFVDFSPSPDLRKLTPGELPTMDLESDDYIVYNLSTLELWVASALPDWLAANLRWPGTCGALGTLMKQYHSIALETYRGNPETCSIMLLTLLELWIACDKSALALFPMLHDYDPGAQLETLQSLVLPQREHMIRLLDIEKYLQGRRAATRLGEQGSIFRDFGTPDCFSVRYHDTSSKHRILLQNIEEAAADERRQKREELSSKKLEYGRLMREYQQCTCDYYEWTNAFGRRCSSHSYSCHKCELKTRFESIQISVHEWPLPLEELKKKSVVFELDAPRSFCAWRDSTMFLLLDVFGAAYDGGSPPRSRFPLAEYNALRHHFYGSTPRRLGLLSEDKPHVDTHRKERFSIPATTDRDICLNNGLNFHYYDFTQGCFVAGISHSDAVPKMCTYQLSEKACTLQPFLFRTFRGKDSTPNEVISSQSGCPEHLSLEEYRYLTGIPVCYRLQWKDLLSQLANPNVDFKKPDTSLVVFQAIYQAGPREDEDFQRASHSILTDENFTEALLSAVEETTSTIEKNWESYQSLSVFSCIVTRQLTLSLAPELAAKALKLLSRLRNVVVNWLKLLQRKRDKTEDEIQRHELAEKIVVMAMICSGTFDVDVQFLERVLMDPKDASILIHCGILIHELLLLKDVAPHSSLLSILHQRWQRLSWRVYPVLLGKVAHIDVETCLDHAIVNSWSEYRRLGCWEAATGQADHWVVSNSGSGSDRSLRVHFNLLTGDLLVNGLPLSRPPPQYERHDAYVELLGEIVLQITPSSVAGMKFSSKQCYADHSLHFGLSNLDLLVQATKDDHTFELVPKRVFRGKIPLTFVDNFIHWYDTKSGTVEFRAIRQPWTPDDDTWILARDDSGWALSKRDLTLINPYSPTGEELAKILAPVQQRLQIDITLSRHGRILEVDLPRLKLAFDLKRGGSSVSSHQFRGMEIDREQSIGTLIGLKNKLVLRNVSTGDRRVIIPFGEVSFARDGDHVSVGIHPSPTSTHVYTLDTMLGLRDNGNIQSQLFLCYLHAITSFCLPDSLTSNSTGTEQALSILKSAAVKSTSLLTKENMDLLRHIEALSPRRSYYPDHLQVMQSIAWNTNLPVLSQHAQFHQCVMDLWEQNKLSRLYYPADYVEPPKIADIVPSLLRRDNLRSSTFRISGFGAEDFSNALDVTYNSRDLGQSSKRLMQTTMHDGLRSRFSASSQGPGPRISPVFLLRQLSHGGWDSEDGWRSLPAPWKPWFVAYGLALTEMQRAKRLITSLHNTIDLKRELGNEGHTNWDVMEFPESLLLEIESNILIREVQENIAANMRQPPDNRNAIMQLNMGEGKSSVIAPAVTAALADGSRLVRVIVAKPQSRQMFHMLVSKLGRLLNRRIFHLPFSRDLQTRLTIEHAKAIHGECKRCIDVGGVMLVQPEHILSFKLMGLQSLIMAREATRVEIGKSLLQTQHLFDTKTRDIVDESDENFSVKFELIYTMGEQAPTEFAPERWIVIQTVLDYIRDHVKEVKKALPESIEVHERHPGSFPRIRLLKEDATEMLLDKVAKDICNKGFVGFPISRQPPASRDSVLKYISQTDLPNRLDIDKVEEGVFWSETTQHHLLLLRGLFAGGILAFAFGHKRWRVNYGLDNTRQPPTKLAVPYRAKDLPTQRSEFSHPDVVITLTCNCYYYKGLSDEDLFLSFDHLLRSNQAAAGYDEWTRDSRNLPQEFKQLTGINMKDTVQCRKEVFPCFRYAKRTIDYFLQLIVFPKQMKEFPQKLSTSGWDIGAAKSHPTTGFSGTVDSRTVLPLDVNYLPLPEQSSTNALVLENLLRPENGVILLHPTSRSDVEHNQSPNPEQAVSEAETLLSDVVGQRDPHLRVILDVGAQILEMTNAQVATRWLEMAHAQDSSIRGGIFFDDNEELMVVDINGFTETLRTSPYGEQLDVCLVFLDEAHTRGTDLKLPQYYRAAVTLGASLTRDRLAQACMRMRKLGQGQSVVFCVPREIQTKIKERMAPKGETNTDDGHIDIQHVLEWAISETHKDNRKSMPLWAAQGQRFERQRIFWDEARTNRGIEMTTVQAARFLEEEAQTLQQRYRPKPPSEDARLVGEATTVRLLEIQARCEEVGSTSLDEATLQEEQERELSPETEQERQLERPPPAEAESHSVHADLRAFAESGILSPRSPAFIAAFESLRETSAAQHLDVSMFPKDVLVTADFARTVQRTAITGSVLDAYQRPVQWILTSQPHNWNHIVIISPYEAHELLPAIKSRGKTTLHIYAPRPNRATRPLDGLDLYTVPSSSSQTMTSIPMHLKLQLNLFAGQLYFTELSEYVEFCDMLGLSWQKASEGVEIAADGFIPPSSLDDAETTNGLESSQTRKSNFTTSPVKFLKVFLMKARRDCQSIEKTHLGKLLDGALLEEDDFKSQEAPEQGLPLRTSRG
ncbi:hypothetical protein VMCG_05551 [Cytospora schulzeri]|uniref:ubiquitinyl hydrolase 1 n=1 Tax=Cytospora schulzeri TaxID=448051 RepID=A0A423WET1_9PEZI|nr:hypothetical protein VMCG_05551 [Valsa malicola]